MIEPNFSESQLQQVINTEITMFCFSSFFPNRCWWFNPIIRNLIEEGELGWDTAFYFPWLSISPNKSGANFFIQYKLSKLIEGRRGNEWENWNNSYLRFQIPYTVKDKTTNRYSDDYSQFNALKKLANKGYTVIYATNHILERQKLFDLAINKKLISQIPCLDISAFNQLHKKVTFTETSNHFCLHSELDKTKKTNLKEITSNIREKKEILTEDIRILKEFLIEIEKGLHIESENSFEEKMKRFEKYDEMYPKTFLEAGLISRYLKVYLDCYWYRLFF